MVMGANVQVCWEKFCRYWEVETRLAPMEGETYHLTPEAAVKYCDENTIGVVAVLGSTFDGSYEPIADICAALDRYQAESGIDVPVHVDGASGGFIAPFIDQELVWDFRLPRVQSINASGHKYGLVYPGVGWVIWRDPDALPEDLVFNVNYLGGNMPTFALNFSRPGNQVAAQYYNFLRLGFDGYRRVQQTSRDVARYTADAIAALGPFQLLTDGSELPVFAFTLKDAGRAVHRVRSLRAAARPRLDGSGVHVPREPPGSRGVAHRRAQRLLARSRRPVDGRPATPRRFLREVGGAAAAAARRRRLRPLMECRVGPERRQTARPRVERRRGSSIAPRRPSTPRPTRWSVSGRSSRSARRRRATSAPSAPPWTVGASPDEIVGTLVSVCATVGTARVVSASGAVAVALGYDIDAAFEEH